MDTNKIIVSSLNQELYTTKRLLKEAQALGLKPFYLNPMETALGFTSQKDLKSATDSIDSQGLFFHRTTGTNYDDFDLLVAQDFKDQGYKITNPIENLNIFRNKDQQYFFLKRCGISTIESITFRGKPTPVVIEEILKLNAQTNSPLEFILKMNRGNQGIGVNFIQGEKSLTSLLETFHALKDQRFLIQPHIKHSREWRLFLIKGEILAVIEKEISDDDFRGNSKRSTGALKKDCNLAITTLAQTAFKASGLDYAGIDILETQSGEFLVLEINAVCGFEQIESLSGLNIARELILKLK